MQETLISFETAKLAKEKKFSEEVLFYYNDEGEECVKDFEMWFGASHRDYFKNHNMWDDKFSAPTQSLLQKWIREVHELHIDLRQNLQSKGKYFITIYETSNKYHTKFKSDDYYNTYEEALEVGLQKALKLIK